MTRLRYSLCRSAGCQVLIALGGLFFATVSANGQSEPAKVIASCPPYDQGAALRPSSTIPSDGQSGQTDAAISTVSTVIQGVRRTSFPELAHVDLRVRIFRSHADYLRTRFSLSRFLLLMPMRYFADVNPALFQDQPPSDGVCAILAHELGHVVSLSRGNRIRRFGTGTFAVKAADCQVRTPHRSGGYPSRLRRRPQKLSRMGLRSHPTTQTPREAAQLFLS
jgi:hypothetical protein